MSRTRRLLVLFSIALTLAATACGGGNGGSSRSGGESAGLGARLSLPSLQLLDVGTGHTVDLASYRPQGKPVLVWAWAPYCPYCRREAPAVEQFARQNRDKLRVVGVGTQNTAGEARAFRRDTGIRSFPLLWEADGFRSWQPFGFTAQPAAALLGSDGRVLHVWSGPFDEAQALRLIGA